ncbi:hypothetical protein ROSA5918_19095 [Roseateles saccharophilus]
MLHLGLILEGRHRCVVDLHAAVPVLHNDLAVDLAPALTDAGVQGQQRSVDAAVEQDAFGLGQVEQHLTLVEAGVAVVAEVDRCAVDVDEDLGAVGQAVDLQVLRRIGGLDVEHRQRLAGRVEVQRAPLVDRGTGVGQRVQRGRQRGQALLLAREGEALAAQHAAHHGAGLARRVAAADDGAAPDRAAGEAQVAAHRQAGAAIEGAGTGLGVDRVAADAGVAADGHAALHIAAADVHVAERKQVEAAVQAEADRAGVGGVRGEQGDGQGEAAHRAGHGVGHSLPV